MPTDKDLFAEEQTMVVDELRRPHRGAPRPPDPRPARPDRRGRPHVHPAAGSGQAGHDPDARARPGGPRRVLHRPGPGPVGGSQGEGTTSPPRSRRSSPPRRFIDADAQARSRTSTWPTAAELKDKVVRFPFRYDESEMITIVAGHRPSPRRALISLAPLETMTIYFMVCIVAGLVLASPWVFYQVWAFVAAGLYRHEQHYVKKFLPFSLGLFLAGRVPLLLRRPADHPEVPARVQRLARHRADPADLRLDELRDDPAAGLRPLLPDARWSCSSWSGSASSRSPTSAASGRSPS